MRLTRCATWSIFRVGISAFWDFWVRYSICRGEVFSLLVISICNVLKNILTVLLEYISIYNSLMIVINGAFVK